MARKCARASHATPLFRTDDVIEFKSNFNFQVSLV